MTWDEGLARRAYIGGATPEEYRHLPDLPRRRRGRIPAMHQRASARPSASPSEESWKCTCESNTSSWAAPCSPVVPMWRRGGAAPCCTPASRPTTSLCATTWSRPSRPCPTTVYPLRAHRGAACPCTTNGTACGATSPDPARDLPGAGVCGSTPRTPRSTGIADGQLA